MNIKVPSQLSDEELIAAVADLAATGRRVTAALIAHLVELEARRLYLPAGYPSLFIYCVRALRLSGGGAYNRIEVARVARAFPSVLGLLEEGALNLATVRLLAPHLTPGNHAHLFAEASGRSKREVQAMLAGLFPKPDVKALIRKLPKRSAATGPSAMARGTDEVPRMMVSADTDIGRLAGMEETRAPLVRVAPEPARQPLTQALSADRYLVRFTASGETCAKLRRAQELLRHAVPDGDPAEIVDRALTALLAELEKRKFAATARPRASRETGSGSRSIPADVRRAVTARDEGQCAFTGGIRRCDERGFLEFHHVVPYARGGPATVENIQLRCRAHNAYEAGLDFGGWRREQDGRGTQEPVRGREQERRTRPGTSWGVGRKEGAGRGQSGLREP